jgi:transcriptional regulator with XRE-family HTH domain
MSIVGENIRKYRKDKYTQQELGYRLGKSKSVVSNWEKGVNEPVVNMIVPICEMLEVTPNQLFGWDERGLPEGEVLLLEFYRRLNNEGQGHLSRTAEGLTAVAEYKKNCQSVAMAIES